MAQRHRRNRNQGERRAPNPEFEPNWDERIEDFEQMELNAELVHGIFSYGFKYPSDIQTLAIHPIVQRRDIIAQAQSGSGKTGAFGIGILNNLDLSVVSTQALILSPTRELATQTHDFMSTIGKKMKNLTVELFIGGHQQSEDQAKAAQLPHVAVATPGRALDLITTGNLRCENLRLICLDEADELLGEDFVKQVQEIFSYLKPEIQILLFSATIPPSIFDVMIQFMKDPVKILVKAEKLTLEGIRQFYVNVVETSNKTPTLIDIFGRLSIQKAVIFANSKATVDFLKQEMEGQNFTVSAIHANLAQSERDRIMHQFRLGATRVLIATDLIARGIDVQQVTLVINFELPKDRESYLHRIGRSGRYGRKGVAINICDNSDMNTVQHLEKFYHTKIDVLPNDIASYVNEANAQFD
ncbi:ATP-dependent RNA helicase eIF4A [Tritrichomonas foetus]|uniref:ATP-dependent RNA helicase eIF4A n=1 Tax=Tritrichomonas foetus TaxID=1144522 RepID=A0A1J4JZU7_9EUKA|nr:ATP-dependent RNA helicase eIF4A [Tritrichomonas foetus]|eukprot:OHT02781.1 ATP-dependent RNA helicase eIF4A [Tritrichomonas foetus]